MFYISFLYLHRETAKDDDIVKLYDLTSLCNDLNEDINQNPFTTPVAMLLFKYICFRLESVTVKTMCMCFQSGTKSENVQRLEETPRDCFSSAKELPIPS